MTNSAGEYEANLLHHTFKVLRHSLRELAGVTMFAKASDAAHFSKAVTFATALSEASLSCGYLQGRFLVGDPSWGGGKRTLILLGAAEVMCKTADTSWCSLAHIEASVDALNCAVRLHDMRSSTCMARVSRT